MHRFYNIQDYKKYLKGFSENEGNIKRGIKLSEFKRIINFIDSILYGRSEYKILMLSLSGSRANGCQRNNSDYDV